MTFQRLIISLVAMMLSVSLFVKAQDNCPLPTEAQIKQDINAHLQSLAGDDSDTMFAVTLSEPVRYTCLATGTVRDTYQAVSIVANFTSDPSRSTTFVHYQRRCNGGIWGAISGDSFETSVPNNLQPPTRTNCFQCNNQVGDPHHCRQCTPPCAGSGRCTGFGVCCAFFAADGTCTDNCTTSDGPNYIANAANDYVCTCNLTCSIGESPNANCTICELSDVCARDSPCGSNGTCTLLSAPSNFTCDCDDGFTFNNGTCQEVIIPTSSSVVMTPSPSPVCMVPSCGTCLANNNTCCSSCNDMFTLSGCGCVSSSPSPSVSVNCLSVIPGCITCASPPIPPCCSQCNELAYTLSGCNCIAITSTSIPMSSSSTPTPGVEDPLPVSTLAGIIVSIIVFILLMLALVAMVAYLVYYFVAGGGAGLMKAKPISPFANGESHNNPLYLRPEEIAEL